LPEAVLGAGVESGPARDHGQPVHGLAGAAPMTDYLRRGHRSAHAFAPDSPRSLCGHGVRSACSPAPEGWTRCGLCERARLAERMRGVLARVDAEIAALEAGR
jgi:hypothetical protein